MPIYEYECIDCGQVEEIFQKISESPLNKCKYCKGRLNKLISQSSFQLKGSGWYVTDYAAGGKKLSKGKKTSKIENPIKPKSSCTKKNIKPKADCKKD
ncbi:MAG: hypothetical protein B6I26_04225 [Desulfobacteraceae bacterium 4572_130]|nr:MAG: hypothetical protein B6I26_04225 [Desulfobacteraceae bacterium 4572_130]